MLYKLDKRLIKRSILQKEIEKLIKIIDIIKKIDASKHRFDDKQLSHKEVVDKIKKDN